MDKRLFAHAGVQAAIAAALTAAALFSGCGQRPPGSGAGTAGRQPQVYPDYRGAVIPPNIAPLNFCVDEQGDGFYVTLRGAKGRPVSARSADGRIVLPQRGWRGLLKENTGGAITADVCVLRGGKWMRYEPFGMTVAREPLDPEVVYRKINICAKWREMGIFQRDVETFREQTLLHSRHVAGGCVHCHMFRGNNPGDMVLQARAPDFGTPMIISRPGPAGVCRAVSVATPYSHAKAGFTSWHPHRDIIAFSLNKFSMTYHSAGTEVRDVFDNDADIALYYVNEARAATAAAIARPDRLETMPEWSRDGKFLYFCSGPRVPPERRDSVRCDLMRIAFDESTGAWGTPDTVLRASEAGGSITEPRFSPDGRYVCFCVSPYSDFPIHQARCDLHVLDCRTMEHRRLAASSGRCDAWHSWSSNGRWIAMSSKRMDGRFARVFFSYFDTTGEAHKPFALPQKDPQTYRSDFIVYNMPECVSGPVALRPADFRRALDRFDRKKLAAVSGATTSSAATPEKDSLAGGSENRIDYRE